MGLLLLMGGGDAILSSSQNWSDIAAFDYYVDATSGNDANAGTIAEPLQTIAAAVAKGASVSIGLKRGETFSGAVSLDSQTVGAYGSGAKPILTHNTNATVSSTGSVRLQNLDIRSTATSATIAAASITGTSTIQGCDFSSNDNKCMTISGGTGTVIEDCTFTDSVTCSQLLTLFQATNCIVRRNTFTRTQTGTQNGFYVHGAGSGGHIFEWNTVNSTVGDTSGSIINAVNIYFDYTSTSDCVLRFNYIQGQWDRYVRLQNKTTAYANIIDCRSGLTNNIALETTRGETGIVYGNTFIIATNTIYGFLADNTGGASTLTIRNNITQAVSGSPFYLANSGSTINSSHNIYFGSGRASPFNSQTFANWQAGGNDANSSVADPLFVDVANSDFRLQSASPAKGTALKIAGAGYRVDWANTTWPTTGRAIEKSGNQERGAVAF